jgi:hypothetical protein
MNQQRWMWIAWPAFLVAGVMEMAVFALIDPADLQWMGSSINWSREAVYTIAFFVFWALAMASSALTTLLSMSPFEVNRCPVMPCDRPSACRPGGVDGAEPH